MTQISYIDHEITQSIDEAISTEKLMEYDEFSIPFLKDYLSSSGSILVSTSGSTGNPKWIEIEKTKMEVSAKATIEFFNLKQADCLLLCLPSKFIAGKMMWVRAITGKMNLVVVKPTSNPIKDLKTKVKFAAMTPHQVSVALSENPAKFDLIDTLIIGGGAVSEKLRAALQQISTQCYATYGMTETITHVAVQKLNGKERSNYFIGIGETTFSVGNESQLIIQAPHLSDEKLVTNDIVELVTEKKFKWCGRLDFVINSGGVKLFPEQIERKLEILITRPFFIWKEQDEKLGERVVLIIESESNFPIDFSEKLTRLESPKKIYFIPQFILTENGKLDRQGTFQLLP
ncbi:MAG: AMP-binding protein [Flavobacteriales bacterium]|nr:AMP-binding protein [Flavobacteriales bacterium]